MSDPQDKDLEIKIAFLERHVEEQDKAILGLAKELDALRRELKSLRDRLGSAEDADSANPADQRPPHY